ncbi:MAG: hypothetical protein JW791_00535 [Nanoarchaeota archaeon]|nr:hypothetical protein [Nanoarchaeota archaeon]
MQKLKRAIKKVAALAGSAIIAASMVTPAMASLANLPSPFISGAGLFNANVIVGSQTWNALVAGDPAGVASDLAGAIDVAAAFAQKALASAGASGTVTLTRPQTPGTLMNSSSQYMGIGDSVGSAGVNLFNATVGGFEWLVNKTASWNSTDYPVWEVLSSTAPAVLNNQGIFTDYGGIILNITSNGTAVFPTQFNKFPMFGNEYQIIETSTSSVKFGQISEVKGNLFGQPVSIGDKATIVVTDWNQANSKAKVTITGADGHIWIDDYYSAPYTFENGTNGYSVTLKQVVISTVLGNKFDVDWTTSLLTLENNGNASALGVPAFENWTVKLSALPAGGGLPGNLSWLAFTSPTDINSRISLNVGESYDVMDYFSLNFEGWRDNNMTSLKFNNMDGTASVSDLYYNTNESTSRYRGINLDGVSGNWGALIPGSASESNKTQSPIALLTSTDYLYFQYYNGSWADNMHALPGGQHIIDAIRIYEGNTLVGNLSAFNYTNNAVDFGWPQGWAWFNLSGAVYNISFNNISYNISLVNWTSTTEASRPGDDNLGGQYFGSNLKWTTTNVHEFNNNATMTGTLTLTEGDGATVTVTYTQGAISGVDVSTVSGSNDLAVGGSLYTRWGSMLSRDSAGIDLTYVNARRQADLWLGRSTSEETSFSVGDTITGTTWKVGSVGAGGSPAINDITPGIGTVDTSVVFTSLSKPAILVGGASVNKGVYELGSAGVNAADWEANRAYFQLVENAFGSGQTVLVIAGFEAKDTKLACQLMAAKIVGLSNLALTGNLVWLDTSGSTYSQVTVV